MAIWEKLFSKITFKDYPDTSTPLNASNMNILSDAIDGIDDRVVELNSNLNHAININISTNGGFDTMKEDIASQWANIKNGTGLVTVGNGATMLHGTYYKYSDTKGSLHIQDAISNVVYVWSISDGIVSMDTLALNANLDTLSGYKDYTIAEGLYARKHYLDCTLFFNQYEITEAKSNNGGNIGGALAPLFGVSFPVFVSGEGEKVCAINGSGDITLYSTDYSSYETGKIRGTITYKTSQINL